MFTVPRDAEITPALITTFIEEHIKTHSRYKRLYNYYKGAHDILARQKGANLANNKLVCNHAKYIADTAVGYLIGNPITYSSKADNDITQLEEWLELTDSDTQDMDIAKIASIFGTAYELVYMSNDDSPTPKLASPDPRNAFVVYDDTVEHKPMFGVFYFPLTNAKGDLTGYNCTVYAVYKQMQMTLDRYYKIVGEIVESMNPFCEVNLIEIYNNAEQQGDFEQVVNLIDAYNILQSDRVNDKEQFVEALLLLKGATLGAESGERSETYKSIKEFGLLELDKDGHAEWLTRQFDESSVEILRKAIAQDIHKFANVPSMSDENFGGNVSGVAMRYKLLGFEQMIKIKERYFKEGLKCRLQLFINVMHVKGAAAIDVNDINIKFTRSLPSNEVELAQIVQALDGLVPTQTLLSLLPFIDDPEASAELLQKEKEEKAKQQQSLFMNTPIVGDSDAE